MLALIAWFFGGVDLIWSLLLSPNGARTPGELYFHKTTWSYVPVSIHEIARQSPHTANHQQAVCPPVPGVPSQCLINGSCPNSNAAAPAGSSHSGLQQRLSHFPGGGTPAAGCGRGSKSLTRRPASRITGEGVPCTSSPLSSTYHPPADLFFPPQQEHGHE